MKKAKPRLPANPSAHRRAQTPSDRGGSRPPGPHDAPSPGEESAAGSGVSVDAQDRILRLAARLQELAKAKSSNFASAEQALEDLVRAEEVFQNSGAWVGLYGPGDDALARGGITPAVIQILDLSGGDPLASPSLRAWLHEQRAKSADDANWLHTYSGQRFRAAMSLLTPRVPKKGLHAPPTKERVGRDEALLDAYSEMTRLVEKAASQVQARRAGGRATDLKIDHFSKWPLDLELLGYRKAESDHGPAVSALNLRGRFVKPAHFALLDAVKEALVRGVSESSVARAAANWLYSVELAPRVATGDEGLEWIKGIRVNVRARLRRARARGGHRKN